MAVSRFNPSDPDTGLRQIVPASVAVGSGSGSVNGNGTVEFSGASSISLNDCFSSNYRDYRIIVNYIGGQTSGFGTRIRLRVSNSDNSNNSYKTSGFGIADLTSNNIYKLQSNGSISYFDAGSASSNAYSFMNYDIFNPYESQKTTFAGNWSYLENDGRWFWNSEGGIFDATTSFTGFTLYTAASTVTGSIQVYGYRK